MPRVLLKLNGNLWKILIDFMLGVTNNWLNILSIAAYALGKYFRIEDLIMSVSCFIALFKLTFNFWLRWVSLILMNILAVMLVVKMSQVLGTRNSLVKEFSAELIYMALIINCLSLVERRGGVFNHSCSHIIWFSLHSNLLV